MSSAGHGVFVFDVYDAYILILLLYLGMQAIQNHLGLQQHGSLVK